MRKLVLLAALLLSVGGLAGCVGGKDEPVNSNQVDTKTPGTGDGGVDAVLQVLAGLKTSVETSAPAWVAPGASVPVAASAPANAQGNMTYTWAIGVHPDAAADPVVALDTGMIAPGKSASLVYDVAGKYEMHCHPHPWMRHNVTVVEGYEGAAQVTVKIIDGATDAEYRYVPENIIIAPGTEVVYENVGAMGHTTTLMTATPALKKLPLAAASGDVIAEGDGWMRISVFMEDEEGRVGYAEQAIYVKPLPTNYAQSFAGHFNFAEPDGLPTSVDGPKSFPVSFEHGGKAFINVTITDAAGVATVASHLIQQGTTQDAMTVGADKTAGEGTINKGPHTLVVEAKNGANFDFTVSIDVVYSLVPPTLMKPMAGGDGHGDHAGH